MIFLFCQFFYGCNLIWFPQLHRLGVIFGHRSHSSVSLQLPLETHRIFPHISVVLPQNPTNRIWWLNWEKIVFLLLTACHVQLELFDALNWHANYSLTEESELLRLRWRRELGNCDRHAWPAAVGHCEWPPVVKLSFKLSVRRKWSWRGEKAARAEGGWCLPRVLCLFWCLC